MLAFFLGKNVSLQGLAQFLKGANQISNNIKK
jgi:hypothetical protein